MISINLLPREQRRPERTPLPRRLAIFLGVGLGVAAGFWCWYLYLTLGRLEKDLKTKETNIAQLQLQALRYDELEKEKKKHVTYQQTYETLKDSRTVLWSKTLYKLMRALDQKASYAWLSEISGTGPSTASVSPGQVPVLATLTLNNCKTATGDFRNYSSFRKLLDDTFIKTGDFDQFDEALSWNRREASGALEKYFIEFTLKLMKTQISPAKPPGTP